MENKTYSVWKYDNNGDGEWHKTHRAALSLKDADSWADYFNKYYGFHQKFEVRADTSLRDVYKANTVTPEVQELTWKDLKKDDQVTVTDKNGKSITGTVTYANGSRAQVNLLDGIDVALADYNSGAFKLSNHVKAEPDKRTFYFLEVDDATFTYLKRDAAVADALYYVKQEKTVKLTEADVPEFKTAGGYLDTKRIREWWRVNK